MNITCNNQYFSKSAVSLHPEQNKIFGPIRYTCMENQNDSVSFSSKCNFVTTNCITARDKKFLINKFESGINDLYLKDKINKKNVQTLIDDVLSLASVPQPKNLIRTGKFSSNYDGELYNKRALLLINTKAAKTKLLLLVDYDYLDKKLMSSFATHEFMHGLQFLTEDFYNLMSLKSERKITSDLETKVSKIDNVGDLFKFLKTIPDKKEREYYLKYAEMIANFESEAYATQRDYVKKNFKNHINRKPIIKTLSRLQNQNKKYARTLKNKSNILLTGIKQPLTLKQKFVNYLSNRFGRNCNTIES